MKPRAWTRRDAPTSPRGPPPTPSVMALLIAIAAGVPVAASFPVASAVLAAAALAVRYGAPPLARRLRDRTDDGEFGPVCVPGTDICLGA